METKEQIERPSLEETGAAAGKKCSLGLRLSRKNLLAAAGVLALAGALFGWQVFLYQTAEEQELPLGAFAAYGAGFWALSLATAFVCLWKVRLPLWASRLAGWVLLLALPLGAFFAVDMINSTRILTFTFEKILANYLCYLMVFALLYAISRRVWVHR